MAQVKCYDPEGNEHMKEPVDARECIKQCGYTLQPPQAVPVEAVAATGTVVDTVVPPITSAPPVVTPEPSKPWVK
jgi:hypothetical protein